MTVMAGRRYRPGRPRTGVLAAGVGGIALLAVAAWLGTGAGSLADVQRSLEQRDRYVQFVDRPATGFALADARGDTVALEDFRGRIVVLNFVYARCTDICLPHMALIADLQQRTAELGLADRVAFVTLATDSEDRAATAQVIAGYGRRFGLAPENWQMLYRGDRPPRSVIGLAAAYGLQFRVVAAGDTAAGAGAGDAARRQVHGAVTHVIDPAGRLRARFHGLRFQPQSFTRYLQALARHQVAA